MSKVKKVQFSEVKGEREIVTGMIISTRFIKEMDEILDLKYISSPFISKIIHWCLNYFNIYKTAPGATIQDIFESKVRNDEIDPDEEELIETFLLSISNDYEKEEEFNIDYYLDVAEKYIRRRSLECLQQDIKASLSTDNLLEAENQLVSFRRPIRTKSIGVDVFKNPEKLIAAFDQEDKDILFSMSGDLGKAIGHWCRGEFVAFVAPAKRGKTFWLEEVGLVAVRKGLKVLWVTLEMTESQILRRIGRTILKETKRPKIVKYPVFDCMLNQEGTCRKKERKNTSNLLYDGGILSFEDAPNNYFPCTVCRNDPKLFKPAIWYKEVEKKGVSNAALERRVRAINSIYKGGRLYLMAFPSGSLKVSQLSMHIENLAYYENFVPDVIVIDYATILAPEDRRKDTRHQLDEKWLGLRGIAQNKHCLVVTAHHTNKATFGRKTKQDDLSEDTRLLNHVTCLLSLNQTPEEKRQGIMKISVLAKREGEFDVEQDVIVLENKEIGKPYLDSYYWTIM